jgi:hypothetical protein
MLKEQHVNPTPFYELLCKEEDFALVFESLEHTIYSSFGLIDTFIFGMTPEITQTEVKRRFFICEKWFRIMRGDCGFSLIRTLDMLPKALACELLGLPFNPEDGADRGYFPDASRIDTVIDGAE